MALFTMSKESVLAEARNSALTSSVFQVSRESLLVHMLAPDY